MNSLAREQQETAALLVVGGGAAGMAAALAAEAAGAPSVMLVERDEQLGGVLRQCLHCGFGLQYFRESLDGPTYAARFCSRVKRSGIRVHTGTEVLSLYPDRTALISGRDGVRRVSFSRCILAAGCRERPIGSLPVAGTRPAGVFTAGAVQRMVNLAHYDVGNEIVILGSGDIGQIMARQLTQQGKHIVAMVEQNGEPGGLARNRRDCLEAFHIPLILRSTVERIRGQGRISGVVVRHLDSGKQEELACDTLITALGLIPEREAALPLMTDGSVPPWLTLCGNCERVHSIVDAVTAQGESAGTAAGLSLKEQHKKGDDYGSNSAVYVP